MSSTVTKRAAGARRVDAVGIPGRQSLHCTSSEVGAVPNEGCWYEVEIRWKSILQDTVVDLGGTEPVFTNNVTADGAHQVNISFLIPSDSSRIKYEEVNVTGKRRASSCEAETEVAIVALKRLATPLKNTKLLDVSQVRYEEAKIKCRAQLIEAEELHLILGMLLSDWADCTHDIENAYDPLLSKIANETDVTSKQIRLDVAKHLLDITEADHKLQTELSTESKAVKAELWKTNDLMRQFFKEPLASQVQIPRVLKMKMTTVLAEMMVSLGWEDPEFTISWRAGNRKCVCEVQLQPKGSHIFPTTGKITVESGEEKSEAKAKENGAEAAILFLELEMSIFLVDVNYNKRSQVESHALKTERSVKQISSLIDNARTAWGEQLGKLSTCDDRCSIILAKHVPRDDNVDDYNMKMECTENVTAAYEACLSRFKRGRGRTLDTVSSKEKRKKSY